MSVELQITLAVLAVVSLIAVYFLGKRRGAGKTRKVVAPPACTADFCELRSRDCFADKVAVITGGGTGLGRSIALKLASRGAKVVIASRTQEHLDTVAGEIETAGGEVMTYAFDVREPEQVDAMVASAIERFGKIDILVNNAAGNFVCPAENLSPGGWRAVLGIVLDGTFYCTSAVGKHMIKQGQGSILNIVANYASSGYPGVVHSAAAKAGVLNMTRTLSVEWGYKGIRVNAIAPGTMPSKGASGARNLGFVLSGAMEKIRKSIPLGRLTDSDEMAELAAFLLSDKAVYINGEVLVADGGQSQPRGFLDLQDF